MNAGPRRRPRNYTCTPFPTRHVVVTFLLNSPAARASCPLHTLHPSEVLSVAVAVAVAVAADAGVVAVAVAAGFSVEAAPALGADH